MGEAIDRFDIMRKPAPEVESFYRAAPAGVRTTVPFSQSARYDALDRDRAHGVIRSREHAFSADGGLAVLYGNIAEDGSIVKTAGVDPASLVFSGPARILESQDQAVEAILRDKVDPGDVVVIRYEGPKGGPGMQEMLYPDQLSEIQGLGQSLRPDYRRPFLRRHLGPVHRPCFSGSRRRRRACSGGRRRHHRDRYPQSPPPSCDRRR